MGPFALLEVSPPHSMSWDVRFGGFHSPLLFASIPLTLSEYLFVTFPHLKFPSAFPQGQNRSLIPSSAHLIDRLFPFMPGSLGFNYGLGILWAALTGTQIKAWTAEQLY